jgi:hypothetical protein
VAVGAAVATAALLLDALWVAAAADAAAAEVLAVAVVLLTTPAEVLAVALVLAVLPSATVTTPTVLAAPIAAAIVMRRSRRWARRRRCGVLGLVFDMMLIRVSGVALTLMSISWGLAETSPRGGQ